ncbi:MAG: hypothetical protein LBK04_01925 [Clostridiales Family XIII bacterium]|jgi:hypothetical protein|nr:hypothetical protein [Clostridiales Family XIII bacterium]
MRKIRIAVVIIFFVLLVLPALFFNRDMDRELLWENRTVRAFPRTSNLIETGVRTYFIRVEDWLGDNVGFKKAAIFAHGVLQYELFGRIPNTHILQGEEGQLFYVNGNVNDPQTIPPEEQKVYGSAEYIEMILDIWDTLSEKEIPFIFAAVPNKEQVYPEYYPGEAMASPEASQLALVAEELAQKYGVGVVNLQKAFLEMKADKPPLYGNTMDPSHWNELGAWLGYLEIMKEVCAQAAGVKVLDENDVVLEESVEAPGPDGTQYGYWRGDETVYTPKFAGGAHFEEVFSYYGRLLDRHEDEFMKGGLTEDDLAEWGFWGRAWHYRNTESGNDRTLLIIGDSYTYLFAYKYFAESFRDVYVIQSDNLYFQDMVKMAIEKSEPDIVVYELVDRMYQSAQEIHFLQMMQSAEQ